MSLLDTADEFRKAEQEAQGVPPRVEMEGNEVTLSGDCPIQFTDGDYAPLLRFFDLDPEQYEIVDPGKISRWQQSARSKDGDRDVVWLFSYSGMKFRRKTEEDLLNAEQLKDAIERAAQWRPPVRRTVGKGLGEPVTYVHLQGDFQSGKTEGGGLAGLQQRSEAALEKSLDYAAQLMARGVNVEAVCHADAGDIVENVMGHYANQPRTAATLRDQMRFAIESQTMSLKAFAELGLPIIAPRTPSNHGEIRPGTGLSPMTDPSDNLDLQIAETVKLVLDQTSLGQQVQWHIPNDEYITVFDLSGVTAGLTHGHKIKGSGPAAVEKWVLAQRDMLAFHKDVKLRLMMMGHFHHFFSSEVSGTSILMTPSMDGGSEWFTSTSGQISTPGLLGFTVGAKHSLGWGDLSTL